VALNDDVLAWARQRMGQQVGSGECFDLADQALRAAGARSAADLGPVGGNVNYIWGEAVQRSSARPGDIVQFRSFRSTITTTTRRDYSDGSMEESTASEVQERPHHTAIVAAVGTNGELTLLEQNVGDGANRRKVQSNGLSFSSVTLPPRTRNQGGVRTTVRITIQVSGRVWFYRPQSR
jgi:hypothetical protein